MQPGGKFCGADVRCQRNSELCGGGGVSGYRGLMWSRKVLSGTGDANRLERGTDFDKR